VWWQIARLAVSSAGRSATRFARVIGDTLYAGWWYLVTGLALVAAYLATMILPTLSARWSAIRAITRAALALTGIQVTVTGAERLPRGNAVILFNHTSYMDAVIIASVLPGEPAFVAKKEKNCDPDDPADARRGDCWDHVALDPEHRLVVAVVPGSRPFGS